MQERSDGALVSLVVPLYREAEHFSETLQEILRTLGGTTTHYEVVLIDDGSPDDTWEVVETLCSQFPKVRAARLSRNFGKEAALAAGLEHARGDAVIVMDGDMQHPPVLISEMISLWRKGADVVEAVKRQRAKESFVMRCCSEVFYAIFSKLTDFDLRGASDYKLMDRRVVDAWRAMGERNLFFRGMNAWLGFQRKQILYDVDERVGGRSSWSMLQLARLAVVAVASFSAAPLYLLMGGGFVFFAFAVVLGLQTLFRKLSGSAVDGFTTIILLLLIVGCALMLGLGVIGFYVARIYEEVKGRPRYVIAEWVG